MAFVLNLVYNRSIVWLDYMDNFQYIFVNENLYSFNHISMLILKISVYNDSALVQVLDWCLTVDKSSPELMMTQLTGHSCLDDPILFTIS